MFLVVMMYAILAATFTLAKTVLMYAKPFFTIGFRMSVAGLAFLAFQYFFNRKRFFVNKEDLWIFVQVTLFNIYFAFVFEFWALQYLSSSKTVFMYSLTPFIVATIAYFAANERLTKPKLFGMIIAFCGMIPLIVSRDSIREAASELFKISLPEVVMFAAVSCAAFGWFPVKKLLNRGYAMPMINGVSMLTGGILALITSLLIEGWTECPIRQIAPFLGYLTLLMIGSNGVFYHLYGFLLKRYTFTFLSFVGFLSPIFGAFFGWLFLREAITWHYFVSLGCIVIGLCLFYQQELKLRDTLKAWAATKKIK